MNNLKKFTKQVALYVGKIDTIQRRIGKLRSLHGMLQRQLLFEQLKIDLVIDVGANEGQFVKEIRNIFRGEIISFEPTSKAYARLVRASSRDELWKIKQLALGEHNTTGKINVAQLGTFSSFLKTSSYCNQCFGPGAAGMMEETVLVRRLDEVLEETFPDLQRRRPFLKINTQGYDLQVLKGLGDKLSYFPALQCEVSMVPLYEDMPHWTEIISFLERAGFAIVNFLPVVEDNFAVVEFDCLMIRNNPRLAPVNDVTFNNNE